ncbi:MAG: FAD-dependent oxidoreductase [Haloferacaceae archaeon]
MDARVAVVGVRDVGPDTVAIEFETPAGFEATPGQFVRLDAVVDGEEQRRFYTLSSPDVADSFEVTVGVDPEEGGSVSQHLAALEPGEEVDMSGPFGSNYYEGEGRVVVLAGGPGVGPAVGIGERAVREGAGVAVVYRDEAPAHRDRLDALADAGATVRITEDSLVDPVAAVLTGEADEQVFVYGFQGFVDEAVEALRAAGTDPDEAKIESFG